jgi:hypothetical protein
MGNISLQPHNGAFHMAQVVQNHLKLGPQHLPQARYQLRNRLKVGMHVRFPRFPDRNGFFSL